jgi:hypothetical protein
MQSKGNNEEGNAAEDNMVESEADNGAASVEEDEVENEGENEAVNMDVGPIIPTIPTIHITHIIHTTHIIPITDN